MSNAPAVSPTPLSSMRLNDLHDAFVMGLANYAQTTVQAQPELHARLVAMAKDFERRFVEAPSAYQRNLAGRMGRAAWSRLAELPVRTPNIDPHAYDPLDSHL